MVGFKTGIFNEFEKIKQILKISNDLINFQCLFDGIFSYFSGKLR